MKYASKQFYHRESIEIVGTTHRSTFFRWSENQKQRRACVVASAFVAKIVNIQKTFIMYSQKVRGERLNWSSKSFHFDRERTDSQMLFYPFEKHSTSQRFLYNWSIVNTGRVRLLVRNTIRRAVSWANAIIRKPARVFIWRSCYVAAVFVNDRLEPSPRDEVHNLGKNHFLCRT